MLEKTIKSDADKTYANLKTTLLKNGCKIKTEESPKQLMAKQGSLWGMTPKTAKKTLEFTLTPTDSGTNIKWKSRISDDWKNITLIGCVLSAVLVGVCGWMALDLTAFMASGKASVWSWLATINSRPDVQVGQSFVNLTLDLIVFLTVIIAFEVADVVYVRGRIDKFAQETIDSIAN